MLGTFFLIKCWLNETHRKDHRVVACWRNSCHKQSKILNRPGEQLVAISNPISYTTSTELSPPILSATDSRRLWEILPNLSDFFSYFSQPLYVSIPRYAL